MRHAGAAAGNLLVVHRRQGLIGRGLAAAIRSLGIKRVLRDRVGMLTTYVNLSDLYHDLGDLDLAEAAARHAMVGGRGLNQHRLVAQAVLSLAAIAIDRGAFDTARDSIAHAETALDEHNRGEALTIRGKLAFATGDGETALALFGRAIEQTRDTGNSHDEAHALIARAELLGDLGAGDLLRAADACTRSGSRLMAWSARARLGRLLRQTGQPEAADRELARAREMLDQVLGDMSPRHLARFHATPGRAELIALTLAAPQPAPLDPDPSPPARDTDSMDTMVAITKPRTRTGQQ
jgi:tetratricopeptide (TPR) repeat protein